MKLHINISLLFLLFLTACDKTDNPIIDNSIAVENTMKIAEMNNVIAWDLFKQEQLGKVNENVLLSPYSIQTALNMALNGAQNETRSELLDFMGCTDCSVGDINKLQAELSLLLKDENGGAELNSVNAFFFDSNRLRLENNFKNELEEHYECLSEDLNFSEEAKSLEVINSFVEQATKGKIDKILSKIASQDVAFLLNALHFKADWLTGFSPESNFEAEFEKADGSTSMVEYVTGDRVYTTFEHTDYRGVDLPLKDSTYSVTLVQASEMNSNVKWSQEIQPSDWLNFYSDIHEGRAIVSFPKLKLAYENDLITSLKNLEVEAPFDPSAADFTAMGSGSQGNVYISQIKHKAVLEMDEKGIEGAAVTSIGFSQNSLPPVYRFDSPYVLAVRHIETNTILFLAYVADAE